MICFWDSSSSRVRPKREAFPSSCSTSSCTLQLILPSWFPGMTISCAHVENVSLAHLLYEQALLTPDTRCGGKSFVITDSGPPVQYCDVFTLLQTLVPGYKITSLSPVMMLMLAHCIEFYCVSLVRWPILQSILPPLPPLVQLLQPAGFRSCNVHQVSASQGASRSFQDGGLGYRGLCTTLEGMCQQIIEKDGRK